MTRAAWSWMTSCQQRGDCHQGPAGPQSLRCQAPTAKLFCQARVLETGDRVWAGGDTKWWCFVSTVICRAGDDDFVICGWWCWQSNVSPGWWHHDRGPRGQWPPGHSHHTIISKTTCLSPDTSVEWVVNLSYLQHYYYYCQLLPELNLRRLIGLKHHCSNSMQEKNWFEFNHYNLIQSYQEVGSLDRQAHFLLVSSN